MRYENLSKLLQKNRLFDLRKLKSFQTHFSSHKKSLKKNKAANLYGLAAFKMVEVRGFEPPASTSRT